jgi:protein-disulfide isomerase
MKKLFILPLFLGLITAGIACNKADNQSASDSATAQTVASEDTQPAKVNLVKYSDYQCPACKYFWEFEKQLKEDFGDDIKIVTKHFPLSMHPYAHVASRSVEAARKQGKYKEMHNKVFEGQEVWSRGNAEAIFIGYAEELGLDVEMFRQDMNSAAMNRIVMADRREGRDLNVNSTPTYFINGDEIENNPGTYPAFKALVEQYMD